MTAKPVTGYKKPAINYHAANPISEYPVPFMFRPVKVNRMSQQVVTTCCNYDGISCGKKITKSSSLNSTNGLIKSTDVQHDEDSILPIKHFEPTQVESSLSVYSECTKNSGGCLLNPEEESRKYIEKLNNYATKIEQKVKARIFLPPKIIRPPEEEEETMTFNKIWQQLHNELDTILLQNDADIFCCDWEAVEDKGITGTCQNVNNSSVCGDSECQLVAQEFDAGHTKTEMKTGSSPLHVPTPNHNNSNSNLSLPTTGEDNLNGNDNTVVDNRGRRSNESVDGMVNPSTICKGKSINEFSKLEESSSSDFNGEDSNTIKDKSLLLSAVTSHGVPLHHMSTTEAFTRRAEGLIIDARRETIKFGQQTNSNKSIKDKVTHNARVPKHTFLRSVRRLERRMKLASSPPEHYTVNINSAEAKQFELNYDKMGL